MTRFDLFFRPPNIDGDLPQKARTRSKFGQSHVAGRGFIPRLTSTLEYSSSCRWLRAAGFVLLGFLLPWLRALLGRRWRTAYVYPRPTVSNPCPRQVRQWDKQCKEARIVF